ncbi:MAG: hypothetical protein AB7G93_10355 [Bdellovibrionales bacterium]
MSSGERPSAHTSLQGTSGQIIVEYVLLLVIGVTIAILITSTMFSRHPERPGFLVRKWYDVIRTIGSDTADDLKPATD